MSEPTQDETALPAPPESPDAAELKKLVAPEGWEPTFPEDAPKI